MFQRFDGPVLRSGLIATIVLLMASVLTPSRGVYAAPTATTTPVVMQFACVSSTSDVMSYSTSTACSKGSTSVTISVSSPTLACARVVDHQVKRVTSSSQCPSPNILVTLPNLTSPTYFCALKSNNVLRYVTGPSQCTSKEFPVVVPIGDHPPVATNDSYSTDEDTALTVPTPGVLGNDTDPDAGDTLTAVQVSGPTHAASFTLNADGSFSYTPAANYNGPDSFTYKAKDPKGVLSTTAATVSLTINAVNDGPVNNVPSSQSVNEDSSLVLSSGNSNRLSVSDVDAGASTGFEVQLAVSHGTLTLSQTTGLTFITGTGTNDASLDITGTLANINSALNGLTYTPTALYFGPDSLVITSNDHGATGSGGAKTDSDTLALTVNHVNHAPVATNDSYSTDENAPLSVTVIAGVLVNDTDADGDPLTAVLVSGPTHAASFTLNADGSFSYTPAANYNGSDSFTYKANDGTADSNVATVAITVNAVNQPPVNHLPTSPQTLNEDATLTLSGGSALSISDPDAGSNAVKVTLGVSHGTLSLSGISGLSFITGTGTGDASMSFTGTIADINSALDGLSYTPTALYFGPDSLTITTDDQGHTGAGGAKTDSDTLALTVTHVNHAPVAMNDSYSTNEDTLLSPSLIAGVLVNDTDADGDPLTAVLVSGPTHAASFTLNPDGSFSYTPAANYNGSDSFTYKANDGTADSNVATVAITINPVNDAPVASAQTVSTDEDTSTLITLQATDIDSPTLSTIITALPAHGTLYDGDGTSTAITSVPHTLAGNGTDVTYVPDANYNNTSGPADTFTFKANDGSLDSNIAAVSVTVNAVNDAPVNSVPATASVDENGSLVFSSGNSNLISTSDVDAGSSPVKITLGVSHGTLTLSQTTGLTFTTGTGTNDASMVFTGTLTDVNAALAGMSYTPDAGYAGSASLSLTTDDQGNTGSGGALTATDTVAITVNAVNQPPVNHVPSSQTLNEDATLTLSGGNAISISDPDAGSNAVKVTLGVSHGTLTLSGTSGLSFITGTGTGDTSMSFTGTMTDINSALDGLSYTPAANYNGPDSLVITTDDQGNTGAGGAKSATDSLAITINAVNDAPTVTVPGAQSTLSENAIVFSGGKLVSVADIDAGSSPVKITLGVSHGTLTLSQTTGLTFTTGDGASDASMVFTGSLTNVNAALNGMSYLSDAFYDGSDSLSVAIDDQGNTGSGGPLTASDAVAITVTHVNLAPVNSVPSTNQHVNTNATLVFSSANSNLISTSDADANGGAEQVSLSSTNGTLTLSQITGLTFITGDGTSDASMSFTGTLANLNAALAGMSYTPTTGYDGPAQLTIATNDQGHTGSGGAQSDSDNVAITVINPPPVAAADDFSATPAVGNTAFGVGTTPTGPAVTTTGSVLSNDSDPDGETLSAGPASITSTQGGSVTMNSDGSFVYLPKAGFTGTDTFTYTVSDAHGSATGTVTVLVQNMVWYVDNSKAAGDGRSSSPFNSLTPLNGASGSGDVDGLGDIIFLYSGSGNYTGGLQLEPTQKLLGQPFGLTVAGHTLVTAGGTNPVITNSSGNGITLATDNTLRGLTVGATTGAKISGSSFGTLTVGNTTVPDVTLSGNGQALSLSTGTFAATSGFTSVATTSSTNRGISLSTVSGTVSFGSTTVSGSTTQGIFVTGSSGLTLNFGNTQVTGGTDGVSIQPNTTTSSTFGTLSVSGSSATAFQNVTGGNVSVSGAASLSSAGDPVEIQTLASGTSINFQSSVSATRTGSGGEGVHWAGVNTGATLTFNSLTVQTNGGTGLNLSGTGTVNVTNGTGTINTTTQAAPAIVANAVALNANFASINSSGGANGVSLTNVTGTSSFGSGALSGASGDEFFVSGSTGSFTYNGTIASGSAHSVNVTGKFGGSVSLGGAITDTDTGISLTSNNGATINFSGGISASTGASTAFTATGGGTVNVTGSNTLDTTSGKGLDLQNTNAGGSGITFAHIVSTSGQVANIVTSTGTKTLGKISTSSGATTALNLSSAVNVNVGDATTAGSLTTSTAAALTINTTTLNLSGLGLNLSTTGGGTGLSDTGGAVAITGGNLGITTTTGAGSGFVATSGGTVSLTGSNNTITSGAGTPLDVESTTIGASNLTFQSITASSGTHGIALISTGSSGHLAVTGTGAAGTGGSITGITGADLATNNCGDLGATAPVGVGIYLKNTTSPSFAYMTFPGTFGNFGILGYSVNGFTLDHTTMTGTYGDNVNVDDDTVHFCTLTGSASITNDTISNGAESNLRVVNASGAVLNRLTLQSDTFGLNQTNGGDGVLLQAGMDPNSNTGTLNATVLDTTFQGSRGSPFQAAPQVGTSMDLVFGQPGHGNTIHNTHSNIVPAAQDLNVAAGGTLTFDINSNHFDSAQAVQAQGGVFINSAIGTAVASGYFRNNTIGTSGVADSGSSGQEPALDVESNGGGDLTIKVDNNHMYQWGANGGGLLVQAGATSGNPVNFNATVTNNTILEPGTYARNNNFQGFQLLSGTNSGENFTSCLDFSGNVLNGSGNGQSGGDARFRQRFDTKVELPGYTGSTDGISGSPTLGSFIQGLNPPSPIVTLVSSTANGGGFFNTPSGAACALPGF